MSSKRQWKSYMILTYIMIIADILVDTLYFTYLLISNFFCTFYLPCQIVNSLQVVSRS